MAARVSASEPPGGAGTRIEIELPAATEPAPSINAEAVEQ